MSGKNPKIILNDGYVDLRQTNITGTLNPRSTSIRQKLISNSATSHLITEGHQHEKELINFGLKKLVNSYNSTSPKNSPRAILMNSKQPKNTKSKRSERSLYDPRFRRCIAPSEKKCYTSQSELSLLTNKINVQHLSPSTPTIHTLDTNNELYSCISQGTMDVVQNKFTMTNTKHDPQTGKLLECQVPRIHPINKKLRPKEPIESVQPYLRGGPVLQSEYFANPQWRDPRLLQKYSVLKMPWRRTWTIPVFTPKSNTLVKNGKPVDSCDRQTYLYDDGTDVDSMFFEHNKKYFRHGLEVKFRPFLLIGGSICGVMLVSFFVWVVFGNDVFHIIFKPREMEDGTIKRYVKYMGGSVIYFISTVVKNVLKALTIPTHEVFLAGPEQQYRFQ